MSDKARILVVDPDQNFRRSLVDDLRRQGHDCDAIADAKAAVAALHDKSYYDTLIANLDMEGNLEFDRLASREEEAFHAPLIAVADQPSVTTAVRALRLGALDYLAKPIKANDLGRAVARAVEKSRALWGVRQAEQAIQTWSRWFRFLDEILLTSGPVRLPPALLSAVSQQRASLQGLAWALEGGRAGSLSTREQEVLIALAAGRRVRQIAHDLRISFHTARAHVRAILRKLGVHSQAELLTALRDSSKRERRGGR
jgi:DNA-binding NarL/FixJ family response regulator